MLSPSSIYRLQQNFTTGGSDAAFYFNFFKMHPFSANFLKDRSILSKGISLLFSLFLIFIKLP